LQGHLEVITLIWDGVTPAACFFFLQGQMRSGDLGPSSGPTVVIGSMFVPSGAWKLFSGVSYLSMTGTGVKPCDKGISFPPQGSEEVWRWRYSTLASHMQVPVRNKTKHSSFAVCFLPSASKVCNR